MIPYPSIDPVLFQIGPLAVRWYSLAYMAGILLGWWLIAREHARRPIAGLTKKALDDMIMWAVIGIIVGGRLGHVLIYQPEYYWQHPLEILYLWHGGMSFHGGFIGVVIAFYGFCRAHGVRFLALMDVIAVAAPIGLFFGRLANFINGELYGRASDVPWAMVFPGGGDIARHPSQLYEAGMEGLALFALLFFALNYTNARQRPGLLSGLFLLGYGLARSTAELFREPEGLWLGVTTGQWLCLPMLLGGLYLIARKPHA